MAVPLVEFAYVYIAIRISVFSMAMLEPIVPLTHVSRSIGPQALPITVSRASDEFTQVAIPILRTFLTVALSLAHCPLAGVIDGVVHGCQGAVTMALVLVELSFIRPGRVSQFAKSLPFAIYPLPLISHTIVAWEFSIAMRFIVLIYFTTVRFAIAISEARYLLWHCIVFYYFDFKKWFISVKIFTYL